MALSNAPFGLMPQDGILNSPYIQYTIYPGTAAIDGSLNQNIFTGDPVQWATAADGANTSGTIAPAKFSNTGNNANNAIPTLGVFLGCEYFDLTGMYVRSTVWKAGTPVKPGTSIIANVARDPNIKYLIQVSCMANGGSAAADIANATFIQKQFPQNFAFGLGADGGNTLGNPATGDLATGQSAYFLNAVFSANPGYVAATLPLKVLGYDTGQNIRLANGTISPFVKLLVKLNNHIEHAGQLGYAAY